MSAAPTPNRVWWTPQALADARLPDLPSTRRGVDGLIAREDWRADPARGRIKAGRGKGWEYHWTLLPQRARERLLKDVAAAAPEPQDMADLEEAFEGLSSAARAKAETQMRACQAVVAIHAAGATKDTAVTEVAAQNGVSKRTVYGWLGRVEGVPEAGWLAALAPRHGRARPERRIEIPTRFWEIFKADYLRLEGPTLTSSYRRAVRIGTAERLNYIPTEATIRNRVAALPKVSVVFARQGEAGLKRSFPPQIRDRSGLTAMEAVNADCHKFDVFVRWPNGKVERPQIIVFQDIFSGKILSWRIDHSPNKVMVMAAFSDMIRAYGIPPHCLFDNGTEFANKWLTGGAATRFRFTVRDDDPLGALTLLGIKVHWATPGHGQAKPVERAFGVGGLSEDIAKDPRFAGAYVGRRPDAKPENYGSAAVSIEDFVAVVAEGIDEHNARAGRTSHTTKGRSFDETFNASYATAKVKKATEAQLRTCLMAQQVLTPNPDHGRIRLRGNMYYAPWLIDVAGKKVAARFDPQNLHAGLHVYKLDGTFLGEAPCQEAVGFFDMDAAQQAGRTARKIKKAEKALLNELAPLGARDVAEALDALTPGRVVTPEAKVVEGRFGDRNPAGGLPPAPSAPPKRAATPEEIAERAAFVADFGAAKVRKDQDRQDDDARVRFSKAWALAQTLEGGGVVGEAEAAWLASYRQSAEWRAQLRMFEIHGEAMLVK